MNIINASYEKINEPSITKKIERIARVCYKSEDRIAEGTDMRMINSLFKNRHLAMLEHGSITLIVDPSTYRLLESAANTIRNFIVIDDEVTKESSRCYLRFTHCLPEGMPEDENNAPMRFIISGNMRAWIETIELLKTASCLPPVICKVLANASGGVMDYIKDSGHVADNYNYVPFEGIDFMAEQITDFTQLTPEERMVHEDISVLFTIDRGVAHELVRHRECSFAQESTRYCNYSKDKHGNEITVISPTFFETGMGLSSNSLVYEEWEHACEVAESKYFKLLEYGATPEQARSVLPHSVKAELVITAPLREWYHVFDLRACESTGHAHPQVKEVMIPLLKDLQANGYEFAFGNLKTKDDLHK